jgi:hypothetical protein
MAKRILVSTSGSRGDVETFLELSKAIKEGSYDVVLSAPPDGSPHMALSLIRRSSTQGISLTLAEAIENDMFFGSVARAGYEQKFRTHSQGVAAASQVVRSVIGAP